MNTLRAAGRLPDGRPLPVEPRLARRPRGHRPWRSRRAPPQGSHPALTRDIRGRLTRAAGWPPCARLPPLSDRTAPRRSAASHTRAAPRGGAGRRRSRSRSAESRGARRSEPHRRSTPHAVRLDAPAAGGRCPLRPPDSPLESQDEARTSSRSATASTSSTSPRPSSASMPPSQFVTETVARGDGILFVGTKKQAQEPIAEEATRAGMPYVNQRWLGGMLTNFVTIRKRLGLLDQLEARQANGEFERLSKKEASRLTDEMTRLQRTLGGMRKMRRLPGALFVVDPHRERIAVTEARKLEIPVIGTGDTNVDPGPARLHHPRQRRRHPRHPAAVPPGRRCRHRGRRPARGPRRSGAGRRRKRRSPRSEDASDELVAAMVRWRHASASSRSPRRRRRSCRVHGRPIEAQPHARRRTPRPRPRRLGARPHPRPTHPRHRRDTKDPTHR